jgi:ATP-dependent DNA helicase RecG
MLKELLEKEESKTLEFKESTQSLQKIVQTTIAFANTAGGTLVIGIQDKSKKVVGLTNILHDEEKVANAISDSIAPLLIPTIYKYTYRGKDVLIINVAHSFEPYYLKSAGIEKGVYMRLGSTNRLADEHAIQEIIRLRAHKYFDEQINTRCPLNQIQFNLIQELFQNESKKFTDKTAQSLGLTVHHQGKDFPSNGSVLLFADDHRRYFPDAIIRLGRFLGTDKTNVLDHQDLEVPLAIALDHILIFIRRHTSMAAHFTATKRIDIPQYPTLVIREAIINALFHTDYSIPGASITVAIFDDRIEITNPGTLPYGLSLEAALSGVSQVRNRVIGRIFRELNLVEQWGSGLSRMISICAKTGIATPKFEEKGNFFRVTLYHAPIKKPAAKLWYKPIVRYVQKHQQISAKQAQKLWKVTARTTTTRLKELCRNKILIELSSSPYDPYKLFGLSKNLQ